MKALTSLFAASVLSLAATTAAAAENTWVTYEAKSGPGKGRHIVLLSGDEEYRGEEGLPQLGKILSQRHGFKCTVLFSVDEDGTINPDKGGSLSNPAALDSADAIVMLLRFRHWDEDASKRFEAALGRGVPIIALRTSTHAFHGYPADSPFAKWNYKNNGGFGRQVLGETWVTHWGRHNVEACLGVTEPGAENHPVLRGVKDAFADSDVYEAHPPADAKILLRGKVLKGMKPEDPPAEYRKKTVKGVEQGVNEPAMPIAWTRDHTREDGKVNKVFCTTMGAATDLQSEGTRRLVVNAVYWGLKMEVPAKANVDIIGEFKPTMFGFKSYKKGVKPSDLK